MPKIVYHEDCDKVADNDIFRGKARKKMKIDYNK